MNSNDAKYAFVNKMHVRSWQLDMFDRIRWEYLLEGGAYRLVSEATNPDSCKSAFAREIIEAMYQAISDNQIKENSESLQCAIHGTTPYSRGVCPWCEGGNENGK